MTDKDKEEKKDKKPSAEQNNLVKKTAAKKSPIKAKRGLASKLLILLLIFLSGSAAAIYFMPTLKERLPIVATWLGENNTVDLAAIKGQLASQQNEIISLEQKSAAQERALSQLSQQPGAEIPADLIERITALEESLALPSSQAEQADDTSQSARIDRLLSRMSQLEASFIPLSKNMIDGAAAQKERQAIRQESTSLSAAITNIENRLAAVESEAARDNSDILLNIKIAELKKRLNSGLPYDDELDAVRSLIEAGSLNANSAITSALDILKSHAATGLITPAQLKKNFNDLIPNIMASINSIEDASWWQSTLNKLSNLITIRNTSTSPDNNQTIDRFIAEIENYLNSDNLKAALDNVEMLPTSIKELINQWTREAENWLQNEEALNEIESVAAENYLSAELLTDKKAQA